MQLGLLAMHARTRELLNCACQLASATRWRCARESAPKPHNT